MTLIIKVLHDNRKLIDLSSRIDQIYSSTRVCVPESLNFCRQPDKLWNSTFVQLEDDISRISFVPDGSFIKIEPGLKNAAGLKCFIGEPELENFVANGDESMEWKIPSNLFSLFPSRFLRDYIRQQHMRQAQKLDRLLDLGVVARCCWAEN